MYSYMSTDRKEKLKKIIACILFISIVFFLLCKVTWIFRGNKSEAREDIAGFKSQGKIDVVLCAGSNLLRYYQPLEAWNQKGYTSYNYATSSARADLLKEYIEDSRTTNEALLYVCDIRTITDVNKEVEEASVRNWSDSLSLSSVTRLKGISSFLFTRDYKDCDIPSFYLDIIKYHSNYDSLKDAYQWSYTNTKNIDNIDKGFSPNQNHIPFEEPISTNVRGELSEQQEYALDKLLNYCEKEKLNVLFICCPYIAPKEEWEILNTCGDKIKERGYTFVNFNEYYDEIGLDFERDFGDVNHVNYLGAEKYTAYLMNYLSENYELPDHREDTSYRKWEEDYAVFDASRRQWRLDTTEVVEEHLNAKKTAETLRSLENFDSWYQQIQDNNFTVIIKKNGYLEYSSTNDILNSFIEKYEIDMTQKYYIGLWNSDECIFSTNDEESVEQGIGVDGGRGLTPCIITSGEGSMLCIGDTDYYHQDADIQVIVYDNNYKQIIDDVNIQIVDDKEVHLIRA